MERGVERAEHARHFLTVLRLVASHFLETTDMGSHGMDIILLFAIFLGQAERRRMTVSDLAHFLGSPRITIRRRVGSLEEKGVVHRTKTGIRHEIEITRSEDRAFLVPLFKEFDRHKTAMIKMDTTGLVSNDGPEKGARVTGNGA